MFISYKAIAAKPEINWKRFLIFYAVSVIPSAIIIFLLVAQLIIFPAVKEAALDGDDTLGMGKLIVFYWLVSGVGGLIAALPIAFCCEKISHLKSKRQQ